jgi:hypothetical protein
MLDWIGSLTIRERSTRRVVLGLSRTTQFFGLALLACGGVAAYRAWPVSPWLALVPLLVAIVGCTLVSLQRELVVDREAGVLRVDQRAFGISNRAVVPLFHLRAVVIVAKAGSPVGDSLGALAGGPRYVAYLDRRVGDAIYLDESRKRAVLWRMAEAIADVAELRLEYEASPGIAASKDN